jgi:hypothetical protein
MTRSCVRPPLDDDRGLIGKIVIVWLLLLAVVVVIAIDAGSILRTRFRTTDLAEDASAAAAEVLASGGGEEAAKLAAVATIADADERVRLKRIDVDRRDVTVVLVARAGTIVVGRIPFFEDLARVTVTASRATTGG